MKKSKVKKKSKNNYLEYTIFAVILLFYIVQKGGVLTESQEETIKFGFVILIGLLTLDLLEKLAKVIAKRRRKKRYLNSNIYTIDKMSGEEFELYLKAHFEENGYKVKTTPASNDYGADLILTRSNEVVAVQAKRYSDRIGNKAIQEVIGSLKVYGAARGMVVTNSYFTSNAKKLAMANDIELWDRDVLVKKFVKKQK